MRLDHDTGAMSGTVLRGRFQGRHLGELANDELVALCDRVMIMFRGAIIGELSGVQGHPVELGGYYYVDKAKTDEVMRPSPTLNAAISEF